MVLAPSRAPYVAYGEGCRLFDWLDGTDRNVPEEVLYEGVVGSGKTRLLCEWVAATCNRYPNSKGLILRSTRTSLSDSVLSTLEEDVLGLDHPALLSGGSRETREFYRHPALGGEIRLGGFNHYEKLYSTQYDWVWWAEIVDKLSNEDAFQRFHRCLRRGATPFSILLSDGNPGDQYHWRNLRAEALGANGVSARLCGRFHDNPRWYDHEGGAWTEEGVRYLRKLKRTLSGPALDQFFYGRWTVASGLVWPEYDRATHEIDAELVQDSDDRWFLEVSSWPDSEPIRIRWFFGAQDVGHTAPGCAQVWGVDKENRAYRVAEIYRRGWNHKEWAERWAELNEEFDLEAIACDHDPAFIDAINDKLRKSVQGVPIAREWDKHRGPRGAKAGIDEVRVRLKRQGDGRRGLYLLKNAVRFQDMTLVRDRLPWKTEMELPGYILRDVKGPGGLHLAPEASEDPDKKCIDHGCDTLRGAMTYLRDHEGTYADEKLAFPRGSVNDQLGLNEWFRDQGLI